MSSFFHMRKRDVLPSICAGLLLFWMVTIGLNANSMRSDPLIQAEGALVRHDYAQALSLAEDVLEIEPANNRALMVAGIASSKMSSRVEATGYYQQLEPSTAAESFEKEFGLADRAYKQGDIIEAERRFNNALQLNPSHIYANRIMGELLSMQGRNWEAQKYLRRCIRQGHFTLNMLCMRGTTELAILSDYEFRSKSQLAYPKGNPLVLADARIDMLESRQEEAISHLTEFVATHPEIAEAQGRLGQILAQTSRSEYDVWLNSLPQACEEHPEVYRAKALHALEEQDYRTAAHFQSSGLILHPDHPVLNYELARSLARLEQMELSTRFHQRASDLSTLQNTMRELQLAYRSELALQTMRLLESLHRYLEICAWAKLIGTYEPDRDNWSAKKIYQYRELVDNRPTELNDVLLKIATSTEFGEARNPVKLAQSVPESLSDDSRWGKPYFKNISEEAGLEFEYAASKINDLKIAHIFETMGGGVAVVDFDQNGWPDLYLAQGGDWRKSADDRSENRLFLNLYGKEYVDVTDAARVGDMGYSHGVTAGDFNSDGWPDLYVCNLGENRFYINNGDGTYSDATESSGTGSEEWSLSAAYADFNGDGFQDLFVVNYLDIIQATETVCRNSKGEVLTCAPSLLPGTPDQLFLNDGSGGFRDVSQLAGVPQEDAKGLGLIVADFFDNNSLQVFVGNDTSANFLFERVETIDGIPVFEQTANLKGLAFNSKGQVQATMGIAVEDFNRDHRLDLFATNFLNDGNTVYEQDEFGFFEEATSRTNLWDAGYAMLGFGTQFFDADLDGWSDLAITNGHVDRSDQTGEIDLMRPQFFQNRAGRFAVLDNESCGPYFLQEQLGRTVAKLDWNNDGRIDFVNSSLDHNIDLLENQTKTDHHYLSVVLVGTECCREPIGSKVVLNYAGEMWSGQLTAGDGYQACNQKIIHFGLGTKKSTGQIEVNWPDGSSSQYLDIVPDCKIIIRQNDAKYYLAP